MINRQSPFLLFLISFGNSSVQVVRDAVSVPVIRVCIANCSFSSCLFFRSLNGAARRRLA